ncbi:BrnT family toxin [Magnetovirga frankeli]|uniref:BrnT family toxin n=1 Tax=Magnetovirga frankeli TaxID=947516 RepID=UPI001294130D|nr:BrnT family toxin [gamma proteobacterium SS-5]
MEIRFDPNKNRLNLAAHGISLQLAVSLEWDLMVCREDDREDYGELRLTCLAPIGTTIYCVTFTEDDDSYRIISLRKATPREARYYVHNR